MLQASPGPMHAVWSCLYLKSPPDSQNIAGPGKALRHPVGLLSTKQQESLKSVSLVSELERTAELSQNKD